VWGLPGAAWRLAPSHQLIGALDPPAVTSVSAPNMRALIFVHGGGAGGAPRAGPGLPEKGWGPRGFGFESVPGGVPIDSTGGARGRAKNHLKSLNGIQFVGDHSCALVGRMRPGQWTLEGAGAQYPPDLRSACGADRHPTSALLCFTRLSLKTRKQTQTQSSQTKNRKKPQSDALPLQRHACRLSCWVRRAQDALYYWHASARPAGHKQRSAQRAKRKRTNEASWSSVLSQTPSSFLFFVWSCWGGALSPAAEKRGAPHARTPHAPRPARTHLPPVPGTPVMPVGPTCVYVAAVSGALAAAVAPPASI
jgi:hypothetical protein